MITELVVTGFAIMRDVLPDEREGEEFMVQVSVAGFAVGFARVRIIKGIDGDLTEQVVGNREGIQNGMEVLRNAEDYLKGAIMQFDPKALPNYLERAKRAIEVLHHAVMHLERDDFHLPSIADQLAIRILRHLYRELRLYRALIEVHDAIERASEWASEWDERFPE